MDPRCAERTRGISACGTRGYPSRRRWSQWCSPTRVRRAAGCRHGHVGLAEDENDTRTAAETLRSQLARHWPVIETVSAANGGFAVLRHADGVEVDMYCHPPQREPGSVTVTVPGSVQLHVDHLERATASEAQAVARTGDESTR